jgi:ABC-type lipoprotein export system ATPase subunit
MFKLFPGKTTEPDKENPDGRYLIHLTDVIKSYHTQAGDFPALKNVSLSIGAGEFVGVIGKSGSGKSTLINMIAGIDRPTKGEIRVADTILNNLNETRMAQWRGHNLGIVFQFFQLLPILTVLENVMLPMDFCNLYSQRQRKDRALQVLEMVDIAGHANKLPSQLSGGEQQRVAIARAMANDPPIIMADEPTGNLDSRTSTIVFGVFEKLVSAGKTIVMVTHDSDLARKVDRTIIIADGEIIEEYLTRAFPALSQAQLVRTTSRLRPQSYSPGSVILRQGSNPDKFYFVTKGEAEVVIDTGRGREHTLERLQRGQYFGGVGLLKGGVNMVTVRSGSSKGAEIAALEKEDFSGLIDQSAETREAVGRTSEKRYQSILDILESK